MLNLYGRGRIAGSRGPADVYAVKNGPKYYFQAKMGGAEVSPEEIRRLRTLAREREGAAVVINRRDGRNRWRFYGNWVRRCYGVAENA